MILIINNFILYFTILNLTLISVIGYGILATNLFKFIPIILESISHYFILGLILIGFFSFFINLLSPINNYISFLILIIGLIIFIFKINQILQNSKKIIFFNHLPFAVQYYEFYNDITAIEEQIECNK